MYVLGNLWKSGTKSVFTYFVQAFGLLSQFANIKFLHEILKKSCEIRSLLDLHCKLWNLAVPSMNNLHERINKPTNFYSLTNMVLFLFIHKTVCVTYLYHENITVEKVSKKCGK